MEPFKEKQQFRQWWIWLLLLAVLIVPVALVLYQVSKGHANFSANEIVYGACGPIAIMIMFYFIRLDTQVDAHGVYYRFFPFQFSIKRIDWTELERAYIRTYAPLPEYGGWGIRFGFGKTGMAYNISGNIGLQLVKRDGKRILIGTNKSIELQAYLDGLVKERLLDRDKIKGD